MPGKGRRGTRLRIPPRWWRRGESNPLPVIPYSLQRRDLTSHATPECPCCVRVRGSKCGNVRLAGLRLDVSLPKPQSLELVRRRRDVVATEHRLGLVTRDAHRDRLRNATANHVAHGGTPEVVEQFLGKSCLRARVPPPPPERRLGSRTPAEVKDELREGRPAVRLPVFTANPPPLDQGPEVLVQGEDAPFAVLRVWESYLTGAAVHMLPP